MLVRFALTSVLAATALMVACGDDDTEPGAAVTPSAEAGATLDTGASSPEPTTESDGGADASRADAAAPFTLSAPWSDGAAIPVAYTCDGANGSPLLSWSGAPTGTQSFAVVMRDTSLAQANNYHWVIFDIPATTSTLFATLPRTTTLSSPANARQTNWSFSATPGYGGPCPPTGTHDYRLTLVALGTTLATTSTDAATVDAAIQAAALATVSIVGTYAR